MEFNRIAPLKDLSSKLISVAEASEMSGLTPGFIRTLIREGKIDGFKKGRDWLTSEEAIRAYLKTDRRPGPKSRK